MLLHHYTIAGFFGFLGFIFLGFFLSLSCLLTLLSLIFIVSILFFIASQFFRFKEENLEKKIKYLSFLIFLFLIGGILGAFRIHSTLEEKPSNHIVHFFGKKIELIGKIDDEVDIRSDEAKYTLTVTDIKNQSAVGKILVSAPLYPSYQYGDIVKIQGIIQEPKDEADFSYKNYLSRYEIYGIMSRAHIQKLKHSPESKLLAWIFTKKQVFLNRLQSLYPEPQASFLAGLLIGARKGMDEVTTKEFQNTGLTHIMAVSGSNITMLLAVILTIFSFLPRLVRLVVSILAITIFTIFVGMSAAVVRAAIMGTIGLIAIESGRSKAPFMALLLTTVIMAALQPKILLWDIGFQLSVAAIVGVIWLVPIFPEILQKLPEHFGIKEAIVLTIAAQITTLPIMVIHFQSFSLIAPLANLFVVPMIPFAMLLGFLSMLPIPFISEILAFLTFAILKASLFIVHILASIPFAAFENIHLPMWVWGIYVIGLGIVMNLQKKNFDSRLQTHNS